MAQNDYKINLGVKVKDNSKNETKKELDKIVKDLQENFKLDLKLKTDALNKQIREYKKEVNSLTKQLEGLKTQLESVSKIKSQSGSLLSEIQKGSRKLTSTNGSKTIDIGLGLTSKNLSKTTISDYGTEKVYEDGIVKAKTFIGATEEAEEKVVSLTVAQKNANKVLEEAVKIQQQLAEAFQKSGMDESAIKSQKEYTELSKIIEKYKTNINTLFERLDKNEKDLRVFDILKNDVVDLQKELTKLSTNAKAKIDEIANSGRSMAEVISKLKESGIDFNSFTFKSESGNITKYADELGRVLTITRKITASGEEDFSYKLSNRFERLSSSVEKTYKDVNKLSDGIINLRRTSEVKEADELKTRIDSLYNSLSALEVKITEATAKRNAQQVNQLTKEYSKQKKILDENVDSYRKLTAQIKNQGGWMLNLKDSWMKAIRSFTTYMSVTTIFYQGVHAIKSMVSEVKNLDDSLTEFKKVSDLAGDSLDRYVKKAYEAGETVAKTGRQVIEASTEFKKSGYTDDQSLELGKIALMYSNIADEEINAGDAASFIIAQLKAFNLEAEDATKTLENAQHVIDSVNEVSNNFAVSSADIANNLGTASAVMANAGNSLEELIGLMTAGTEITRNASKVANGLKTITLRLQGMDNEGEKSLELQAQMEGLFNKLGVSVYDANGELKNTYDILGTLAEVYPKLTTEEKAYVTETIAGKHQAQNAAAILNNWKTAVEATATAMNSQGSAAKENERVLDSIQGHLQKLKSAWEELSTTVVDSDLIKIIVDLGTALLNFANSGMGQFIIKVGLAVGAISLLKAGYNALTRSAIKYIAIQKLATKGITDFTIAANAAKLTKEMETLSKNGVGLQTVITTIGAKGKGLLGVLGSIVKFIGPAGWIILGLTAIATVTKKIYNYTEEETEKQLKRYEEVNKQLDEYKKRLEELKGYKYLSDSEKEEIETLKEKIQLLEDEKDELKEIYETEKKREELKNTKKKSKEARKALNEGDIISVETTASSNRNSSSKRGEIPLPSGNKIAGSSTNKNIEIQIETTKDLTNKYSALNKEIKEGNKTEEESTALIKEKEKALEKLKEKAEKYKEAYDLAAEAGDTEIATEAWNKYLEVLKIVDKEEYNRIANLETVGDRSIEEYNQLNNIIKEYNKTQKLTDEQTHKLINSGMRSAITFDKEGNAVSLDADAMWALYKAKLEQNKADLTEVISNNIELLKNEGYAAIADAKAFVTAYNLKYSKMYGPPTREEQATLNYINQLEEIEDRLKSIDSTTGKKQKKASSTSSSKTEKSWWEEQLETLKEQYSNSEITIEEYIKALEKLLGKLKKGSDAWKEVNKLLQEQKLSKIESDYKRGVISLDEYIKKLQELIKTYKQGTKAWQDLADKIKEGLLDKAEQEQKDYENAAKAATSIIDDEIKRLEELRDAKQKANDETEKELELAKLQEALEKARNERTKRVFVEGKGWTYVQDEQAIKEAQEALDEFNKEQETNGIDKQIEALEKYKEAWSNVSSDYEKEQQKLLLAQQFGADAEEKILNKRLDILEEYRKRYLETLKQISDIEKKTAEEILGATTGTSVGTGSSESGASEQAVLVSSIKAVFGQGRKNNKNDVKTLQQALMALGYSLPKYGADGKWGPETLKALKKFQKDNGLKADGIVGKNTKSAFAKKGYANGGVVDYTGYAMVHGSVNYPEVMLNNRQAAKLYSMLSHPAYNRVGNTSNTTQVYNFDKLVLPNVKNANQFLSELKALVNITKNN